MRTLPVKQINGIPAAELWNHYSISVYDESNNPIPDPDKFLVDFVVSMVITVNRIYESLCDEEYSKNNCMINTPIQSQNSKEDAIY